MNNLLIVVAGATGNLGGRIVKALAGRQARVRALVRNRAAPDKVERLQTLGAEIARVDYHDPAALSEACSRASCVVSALQGR
jgi:uncharacterized protein YbjT (DUF2867 family)